MAEKLKIGMIGCGEIAVHHAKGIAAAENAQIVMVMDTREEIAGDMAKQYDAAFTTSCDELLTSPEVQAVYVATPHFLHAPLAIQAAEAGKHVMVEKPIALNAGQGREMVDAANKNGVLLSVCYVKRCEESIRRAGELIRQGAIGDVIGTRIAFLGAKPAEYWHGGYTGRVKDDWRTSKEKCGGGVLMMNSVHEIDAMLYITGLEVVRVYAETATLNTPVEVEDIACATLRYNNDAVGVVESVSCLADKVATRDSVLGTKGQIVFGDKTELFSLSGAAGLEPGKWHDISIPQDKPDRAVFTEEFAQAVFSGASQAPIGGEIGVTVQAIVDAAYASAESQEAVGLK